MAEKKRPRGRPFKKGNPGGPGRPRREVEREYLGAILGVVSLDDWRLIVAKAKRDAIAGDRHAREWLSKYIVGDSPLLADLNEEFERVRKQLTIERRKEGW